MRWYKPVLILYFFALSTLNAQIYISPYYKKDTDQDQVPDVRDKCPDTPKGVEVDHFGCPPDRDHDGIYDYEDLCPDLAGPVANQGCPYQDSDGDSLNDEIDHCPQIPGLAKYKGCPPPDRDGDQVIDEEDLCPDVPGSIINKGCPEVVNQEEEKILEKASRVLFEYGSWIIKEESFPILNEVVKIMQKYPKAQLQMEGHTDSDGSEVSNQTLSENRAASVKQYLIEQGIEPFRLESTGYGESRPIADNHTSEGRQKNRRVKMIIYINN